MWIIYTLNKNLINMPIQYLSSGQTLVKDNNKNTQARPETHLQPTVFTVNHKRIPKPNSTDPIANQEHAFIHRPLSTIMAGFQRYINYMTLSKYYTT